MDRWYSSDVARSWGRYAIAAFFWFVVSLATFFIGMGGFSLLLDRLDATGNLAAAATVVTVVAMAFALARFLQRVGFRVQAWIAVAIGCTPYALIAIASASALLTSHPSPVVGGLADAVSYDARVYVLIAFWCGLAIAIGSPVAAYAGGTRPATPAGI